MYSESCFATLILLPLYAGKTAANIPDNNTNNIIRKKSFVRVNEISVIFNGVIEVARMLKLIKEMDIPTIIPRKVITPPSKVIILKILCLV